MKISDFINNLANSDKGVPITVGIIVFLIIVALVFVVGFSFLFFKTGETQFFTKKTIDEPPPIILSKTGDTQRTPVNYLIQGVPPVTIYNHVGDNAYLVTSAAAAIKSVLEFYGEELSTETLIKINNLLYDADNLEKVYDLSSVKSALQTLGFEAEIVALQTIDELARFINESEQIPLIFRHKLTIDQPKEITFVSDGVLIGISESTREFVFHDYYLGYNKRLSFDDFEKLLRDVNPSAGHLYLAIQPKNEEYKKKQYEPYPERTESMNKAELIINKITLARVASILKLWDLQIKMSEEAIHDPNFAKHVPPYYRVVAYAHAADNPLFFMKPPDIAKAEILTEKAESINVDLDRPFSDYWPGFVDKTNNIYNISDAPFYLRGVIERYNGEYDRAIESFKKALSIWPHSVATNRQLEIAEQLKNKKQIIIATKQQMDDQSLSRLLVDNSPWIVAWNVSEAREGFITNGTHKISFVLGNDGVTLSGKFSEISSEITPGPMGSVSLKDGCVRFVSVVTGTKYEYCLTKDGALRGFLSGTSPRGGFFTGDAVARSSAI